MTAVLGPWLEAFVFLRPWWLLALVGLPLAWWSWRRRLANASPWRGVVDPALQPHVLDGVASPGARIPWRWATLYLLGVLALAGPAWKEVGQPALVAGDALVVALDLSSSSRAADLAPDRATRARLKLARVLEMRQGGQLGLVAFAGSAHVVSPLTHDARTLRRLVDALEPGLMPVDGHRVDLAIERAQLMMQGAGETSGRILVLTDRADAAAVSAARSARDSGFTVHVLGLGTPEGAPVRAPSGGFTRDTSDRLRMARLEPASLERLAAAGGGRFTALRADDADLAALGVLEVGTVGIDDAGRRGAQRRDEGFWLVLLMLPLLLPEFRRGGVLALAALLLMAPAPPAVAADPGAMFKRDDQRAWQALVEGDPERALSLARDPSLRGAAAYRLGDFDAAIEAFGEAGGLAGAYNRGNALAGAGRYDEALDAWRGVLEHDPGHEDARANLEALEQWLQQQPPPPEQDDAAAGEDDGEASPTPGDGEEGDPTQDPGTGERADAPEDEHSDQARERPSPGEPAEEGDGQAEAGRPEPVDPDDQAAAEQAVREAIEQALQAREEEDASAAEAGEVPDPDALAEREEAEAIERWLRLVEDDPGALLRRKFMMEHQRRERGGGE